MSESKTPFACSICKREFRKAIFLVKHVELRHPSSNRSSTCSNNDTKTNKLNLNVDKEGHSSDSKNETKTYGVTVDGGNEYYNYQWTAMLLL